jgi:uncharacterized protein
MRRNDKEITDPEVIEEILNHSQVCRIALHDGEYPYIVPFNYGYQNRVLYFHSAASGKKISLIQENNKACFEIEYGSQIVRHEQACKWTAKYRSVIGYGTIDILTDPEEKKKGLDKIMEHYGKSKVNVYNEKHVKDIVILRLTIEKLTGKQSGNWEE